MLVEPPRQDLPPRHRLRRPAAGRIRRGASVGSPVGREPPGHPSPHARASLPPEVLGPNAGPDRPLEGRRRPQAPRHAGAAPQRPRPGSDRSFLWRWRRGLFLVGLVFVATTGGARRWCSTSSCPPEESLLQTSFVCAADVTEACGPDNAIATFSAEEDRTNVQLDEVPDVLEQAVLATEDRDYYEHGGIDPVGIGRAPVPRRARHAARPRAAPRSPSSTSRTSTSPPSAASSAR